MKSKSLHCNQQGQCFILAHDSGRRWKLSAAPIPLGDGVVAIQQSCSIVLNEWDIQSAIALARGRGERFVSFSVGIHTVSFPVKNVEQKIKDVHDMEELTPTMLKREKKKRRA